MIILRQKEYGLRALIDKCRIFKNKLIPRKIRNWKKESISGNPEEEDINAKRLGIVSGLGAFALSFNPIAGALGYFGAKALKKGIFAGRNLLRQSSDHIDRHFQRKYDRLEVANGNITTQEYLDKHDI